MPPATAPAKSTLGTLCPIRGFSAAGTAMLTGQTVRLVVEPQTGCVVSVENAAGASLGAATALDVLANCTRHRRKPDPAIRPLVTQEGPNLIEIAYQQYHDTPEV